MKHKSLLFAVVTASLLFGSADAFAQRSSRAQHSAPKSGSASNASMTPRSHYNPALANSGTNGTESSKKMVYYRETNGEKSTESQNSSNNATQNEYSDSFFYTPLSTPDYGKEVSKRTATRRAQVIRTSSDLYYYRDGIFYLHDKDKYVIHAPNAGFRVAKLPLGRLRYEFEGNSYYYFYGSYYTFDSSTNEYVVVVPPAQVN